MKLSFIVVFFRMTHKKKLFRRSNVKYRTFSEGPTSSNPFPLYCYKKYRHKLSKYCSIHGENCEISGPYNFWTSVKSNIPDSWNWNFWSWFGLILKWECHAPPWIPQWLRPWISESTFFKRITNLLEYIHDGLLFLVISRTAGLQCF